MWVKNNKANIYLNGHMHYWNLVQESVPNKGSIVIVTYVDYTLDWVCSKVSVAEYKGDNKWEDCLNSDNNDLEIIAWMELPDDIFRRE